jgi:disulfide bond formation protein DsbB
MYQKQRNSIWGLISMLLFLLGSGFGLYQALAAQQEHAIYLPFVQQPFPFAKTENSPLYLQNSNSAGCEWMGVAGEILNTSGQPLLDE